MTWGIFFTFHSSGLHNHGIGMSDGSFHIVYHGSKDVVIYLYQDLPHLCIRPFIANSILGAIYPFSEEARKMCPSIEKATGYRGVNPYYYSPPWKERRVLHSMSRWKIFQESSNSLLAILLRILPHPLLLLSSCLFSLFPSFFAWMCGFFPSRFWKRVICCICRLLAFISSAIESLQCLWISPSIEEFWLDGP